MIVLFASLLVFSSLEACFAQEIITYINELPINARRTAIGILTEDHELLAKQEYSVIEQNIIEEFNTTYGGKWRCFIGSNETIHTILTARVAAPNTTLYFSYDSTHVLIFKTQVTCQNTFQDVVTEAMSHDFNKTYNTTGFNATAAETILTAIKQTIQEVSAINCATITTNDFDSNYCYYILSSKLYTKVSNTFAGHTWYVSVGTRGSAATYGAYNFRLNVVFNNLLTVHVFEVI